MKKYMICILAFWLIGAGAAGAYELGNVDIHGFIAQGYLQSSSNDYVAPTKKGTFEFNEMGINFTSELTDDLRVGVQLFASDFGDIGNDEVILDWAYGDYRFHNMLGLRAGKFKVAQGFYNEVRDVDAVRTSIILPRSAYALNMRDVFNAMKGVGLYGELPAGFSYQGGVGIIDVQADSELVTLFSSQAQSGLRVATYDRIFSSYAGITGSAVADALGKSAASNVTVNSVSDFSAETTYNFAFRWDTPLSGLRLGYTLMQATGTMGVNGDLVLGPVDPLNPAAGWNIAADQDFVVSYDVLNSSVVSAEYTWRDLILTAEANAYRIKAEVLGRESVRTMPGWYGQISYRFTDWLELGTYYSEFYEDIDDRKGENYKKIGLPDHLAWEKDWALSARFDINEYWIFKAEAHHIDGTYQMKQNVFAAADPFTDIDREFWLFAGKISFSF